MKRFFKNILSIGEIVNGNLVQNKVIKTVKKVFRKQFPLWHDFKSIVAAGNCAATCLIFSLNSTDTQLWIGSCNIGYTVVILTILKP